jgi:hypothetical protein
MSQWGTLGALPMIYGVLLLVVTAMFFPCTRMAGRGLLV